MLEEGLQQKSCLAEALASVFLLLRVKHLCAHFISSISFSKVSPDDQTRLFFYCASGKMA